MHINSHSLPVFCACCLCVAVNIDKKNITSVCFVQIGATQGDGYASSKGTSPHTVYEKFEGLTVNRAAEVSLFPASSIKFSF